MLLSYVWETMNSTAVRANISAALLRGSSVAVSNNSVFFLGLGIHLTLPHVLRHVFYNISNFRLMSLYYFLFKSITPDWSEGVFFALTSLLHKNKETSAVFLCNFCIYCSDPWPHKVYKLTWLWLLSPEWF